jgi:hypothetical protein
MHLSLHVQFIVFKESLPPSHKNYHFWSSLSQTTLHLIEFIEKKY